MLNKQHTLEYLITKGISPLQKYLGKSKIELMYWLTLERKMALIRPLATWGSKVPKKLHISYWFEGRNKEQSYANIYFKICLARNIKTDEVFNHAIKSLFRWRFAWLDRRDFSASEAASSWVRMKLCSLTQIWKP